MEIRRTTTVRHLMLATRDRVVEDSLVPALAAAGFEVQVARANLELVWKLQEELRVPGLPGLLLDTRAGSFGTEALRWLKDEPLSCALIALAHRDDASALQAAELAEAAGVVFVRPDGLDARAVTRDVCRLLRPQTPDPLRWTLPRAAWLRAGSALPSTMRAAEA